MLASGPLAPVKGGYLPQGEVDRVSSDLNAGLQLLSAHRESAWLPQIGADLLAGDGAHGGHDAVSLDSLFLLGGKLAVDHALAERLPQPPGSRPLPMALKGKSFFGGSLSWSGRNAHLIPPDVLGILRHLWAASTASTCWSQAFIV